MKRRRRYFNNRGMKRLKLAFVLLLTIIGICFSFVVVSERMLPLANAMAVLEAKNRINRVIYDTVNQTVVNSDIVTADFYGKTEDADGMLTSLAVNTVLVNTLCAEVAESISDELAVGSAQTIAIPVGALTGIEMFANLGPEYSVKLLPGGAAEVDYETAFEAVGINQINFQVWLNVSAAIRIVNPLQTDQIVVARKVSLVNTVFSGKVPENFVGNLPINVGNERTGSE